MSELKPQDETVKNMTLLEMVMYGKGKVAEQGHEPKFLSLSNLITQLEKEILMFNMRMEGVGDKGKKPVILAFYGLTILYNPIQEPNTFLIYESSEKNYLYPQSYFIGYYL